MFTASPAHPSPGPRDAETSSAWCTAAGAGRWRGAPSLPPPSLSLRNSCLYLFSLFLFTTRTPCQPEWLGQFLNNSEFIFVSDSCKEKK